MEHQRQTMKCCRVQLPADINVSKIKIQEKEDNYGPLLRAMQVTS